VILEKNFESPRMGRQAYIFPGKISIFWHERLLTVKGRDNSFCLEVTPLSFIFVVGEFVQLSSICAIEVVTKIY
jgi:hypothetical protein